MTRRIQSDFSKGMISDRVTEDSLLYLKDMYVRRPNEICSRSYVRGIQKGGIAPTSRLPNGWGAVGFHPNFGTAAIRGSGTGGDVYDATEYQLMAAPLQGSSEALTTGTNTALEFEPVTENGAGSVRGEVCVAMNGGTKSWYPFEFADQVTNSGNEMVFAGRDPAGAGGRLFKYGGSLLPAYETGTVSVSTGEANMTTITGSNTLWAANVEAGQYILIDTITEKASTEQRAFRITSVNSNTDIEIEKGAWLATANTGLRYRIQSVACVTSPDGVWNATDEFPRQQGVVAYWQNKLWTAGVSDNDTDYNTVYDLDKIRYSGTPSESEGFFSHMDLWHNNGWIRVFPGIGGAIMGLVPMGASLIVLKAHAIFKITGSQAYDSTGDSSYKIDIISETIGATTRNAFGMTKAGLVIASTDGLYLLNDDGLQSLTDGRLSKWWESTFIHRRFAVHVFDDKVIVNVHMYGSGQSNYLVWMIDDDYFWEMSSDMSLISVISTYSIDDIWIQDYGFSRAGEQIGSAGYLVFNVLSNLTHQKEFEIAGSDTYTLDSNPELITHPIPIGEDPASEGRVNNILIHGLSLDGSSENIVSLLPGSTAPMFDYQGNATSEGTADEIELEYTFPQGTTDRAHRIPVEDMDPSPTCRIRIDASTGTEPNPYRVYAIGIDSEESNVTGPT